MGKKILLQNSNIFFKERIQLLGPLGSNKEKIEFLAPPLKTEHDILKALIHILLYKNIIFTFRMLCLTDA